MPELPDVAVYVESLNRVLDGATLRAVDLRSPFVLRTVEPPLDALVGRAFRGASRHAKRIVLDFGDGLRLAIHLMIAGRLRWRSLAAKPPQGKNAIASLTFDHGRLWLTEASSQKRAALHVIADDATLAALDRGGLEVLTADLAAFRNALTRENRTLKRALTDPRILAGIGNAYSDEILFRAKLSPVTLTSRLTDDDIARLFAAARAVLVEWTDRLRAQVGDAFPEKVTAFRPEMAVHGRYREPCLVCATPIQRIRYASNECNYCPTCQCGGKLLADRGLSRLMREDWPKTLEELEERKRASP